MLERASLGRWIYSPRGQAYRTFKIQSTQDRRESERKAPRKPCLDLNASQLYYCCNRLVSCLDIAPEDSGTNSYDNTRTAQVMVMVRIHKRILDESAGGHMDLRKKNTLLRVYTHEQLISI